ncbi:MAG: hypothetical protein ACRDKI_00485 [Solirubrobacterales bacterium]
MKLFKRAGSNLTYANVVATLALFLALGGVSYAAATLPKNSVGTKQIKKNAVTGAKIKSKTITGSDIKKSTITADKLKTGTVVPAAATATDTFIVNKKGANSANDNTPDTAAAAATEIPLYTTGPFTLYGKCYHDTDDDKQYATIYARTTVDGALASFYDGFDYSFRLDTTTPEANRFVSQVNVNNNDETSDFTYDATYLEAPDGNGIYFSVIVQARNGNPADASTLMPEDSCVFSARGVKFKTS